jgi:hypothetical protein
MKRSKLNAGMAEISRLTKGANRVGSMRHGLLYPSSMLPVLLVRTPYEYRGSATFVYYSSPSLFVTITVACVETGKEI